MSKIVQYQYNVINEEDLWIPCDRKFYNDCFHKRDTLRRIVLLDENGKHHEDCLCDECEDYEVDF